LIDDDFIPIYFFGDVSEAVSTVRRARGVFGKGGAVASREVLQKEGSPAAIDTASSIMEWVSALEM
jgi:hypothetical protein